MLGIGTLTTRLVAGAVIWIAGALVAGGFLLAALFEDHVNRSFDRRLQTLIETVVAVTDAEPGLNGAVRLLGPQGDPRFDQPFSGLYWQINEGDKVRLASRSLWDRTLDLKNVPVIANADGIPIRRYEVAGPRDQRLRVIERDITLDSMGPTLRYAVAGDLAAVEEELRPFMVTLIWSLGILGAGLVAAVFIQVYIGLRPLDRLREALGRIRAGRAQSLKGAFPSEVRPLVDEANQLIAHIGEVVDRARTHVGNLAHALKTPLSVLANEAARSEGPLAEAVARETAAMQDRIDHHLARARTAATGAVIGQRAEVKPIVDGLSRALSKMYAERSLAIDAEWEDGAMGLSFRGDAHDLEEMLGNLMENACKWAHGRVVIRTGPGAGGRLRLVVEDDGPGLAPDQREVVLARGERLDETVPGSGLGLAIVSEIAGLYGGALSLADADIGGLRATLDLPAAAG